MGKRYTPGSRRSDLRNRTNQPGTYSDKRWAWLNNILGQFVTFVGETDGPENGPEIGLAWFHPHNRRKSFTLTLTHLTVAELDAFQRYVNHVIEWARPVCEQRDKDARDAFDNGSDHSLTRLYRGVSTEVYRIRPKYEYREGVQLRLEGVSQGDGTGLHPGTAVRDTRFDLAEHYPKRVRSEDDEPPADEPESVREVGESAERSERLQGTLPSTPHPPPHPREDAGDREDAGEGTER